MEILRVGKWFISISRLSGTAKIISDNHMVSGKFSKLVIPCAIVYRSAVNQNQGMTFTGNFIIQFCPVYGCNTGLTVRLRSGYRKTTKPKQQK